MRPLLQASLIFVLSLLLTDSAVAQETPRDLLDEQAGFVPAAQLDEIRESFEAHLMREETRQSKLQSDLIKIKANQEIDPVEVEEKLDALRTLEQQWKKNLSADHHWPRGQLQVCAICAAVVAGLMLCDFEQDFFSFSGSSAPPDRSSARNDRR